MNNSVTVSQSMWYSIQANCPSVGIVPIDRDDIRQMLKIPLGGGIRCFLPSR
jgi:hypothetical protein